MNAAIIIYIIFMIAGVSAGIVDIAIESHKHREYYKRRKERIKAERKARFESICKETSSFCTGGFDNEN